MESYAAIFAPDSEWTEENGCVYLPFTASRQHLNGRGILHGGLAYLLCAEAVSRYVEREGRSGVGVDGNIHHYRSARAGQALKVFVSPRKEGHRVGVYLMEVVDEGEQRIADAAITVMYTE